MGAFLEFSKKTNCSTLFLMPIFKVGIEKLKKYGFINTYLDDMHKEDKYERSIYFLFKPPNMYEFGTFLEEENSRHSFIVDDYDYPPYVVVVYQLPEDWKEDYQLFYEGRYSEFSEAYKNKFPKYVHQKGSDIQSIQWCVFSKSPKLKKEWEDEIGMILDNKLELWESPRFDREVLDIDVLIKNDI